MTEIEQIIHKTIQEVIKDYYGQLDTEDDGIEYSKDLAKAIEQYYWLIPKTPEEREQNEVCND